MAKIQEGLLGRMFQRGLDELGAAVTNQPIIQPGSAYEMPATQGPPERESDLFDRMQAAGHDQGNEGHDQERTHERQRDL